MNSTPLYNTDKPPASTRIWNAGEDLAADGSPAERDAMELDTGLMSRGRAERASHLVEKVVDKKFFNDFPDDFDLSDVQ